MATLTHREMVNRVHYMIQWNFSINGTLNKGDTSLTRTVSAVSTTWSCVQIYLRIRDTSLCRTASWVAMVSSIEKFHCIQDSQLGSNGVLYREVPLYFPDISDCVCPVSFEASTMQLQHKYV